ncbi:hypothetical protein AUP68_06365 [Ilyonectria robusta]
MDALCSRFDLNEGDQSDDNTKEAVTLTNMAPFSRSIEKLPDSDDAHDADIAALNPNKQPSWHGIGPDTSYASVDHYLALRLVEEMVYPDR